MILILKKYIPLLLLFALFSSIVLMDSVPPVSRDALTQHLAVPKLYVEKGGIRELPNIVPSYYPQLLDLIYCIPMISGNDIVPKYIHFSFALLTALLIFLYVRKRSNRFYGILSVLFFLSLPVIVKLSVTVYVDLGLIFFSTASLFCLLKWHDKQFQFRWLLLSAVFCGLALSTKYNGLITYFLLTTFTPLLYLNSRKSSCSQKENKKNGYINLLQKDKSGQIQAAEYGICFLLISAAVFSPWMIKDYIWTGNPVYPLYNNFFNPPPDVADASAVSNKAISKDNNSNHGINHFLVRKYVYNESWLETAAIPFRIFFQGEDDNPRLFDGRLNPLLFFLPFFAFLLPGKILNHNKILLLFSSLYILIVFFQQDMRIRWIGPAIPPLVILSALGLKNLFQYLALPAKPSALKDTSKPLNYGKDLLLNPKKSFLLILSVILIVSMASLNAVYIYKLFKIIAPQQYITHQVTRSEYIERFRPEYASLEFANHNLNGKTKLLAFFLGNRRYYSDHDIRFNYTMLKNLAQDSKTGHDIFQGLKKLHYTDLVINYPKFNSWIDTHFNTSEKKRVQTFFLLHTKRLFSKNGYGLYQLISNRKF